MVRSSDLKTNTSLRVPTWGSYWLAFSLVSRKFSGSVGKIYTGAEAPSETDERHGELGYRGHMDVNAPALGSPLLAQAPEVCGSLIKLCDSLNCCTTFKGSPERPRILKITRELFSEFSSEARLCGDCGSHVSWRKSKV